MDFNRRARTAPSSTQYEISRTKVLILVIAVLGVLYTLSSSWTTGSKRATMNSEPLEIPARTLSQLEEEPEWDKTTVHAITIQRGDTVAKIFQQHGLSHQDVHFVVNASKDAKRLNKLTPGRTLRLSMDALDTLQHVEYPIDDTRLLRVSQNSKGHWYSEIRPMDIETRVAFADGLIKDSFYLSGKKAGLNDGLIMALADLFAWDIDFIMDIRPGDHFRVLYEERFLHGEPLGAGQIVAASFSSQGKTYEAIRFTDASGNVGYYTPDGQNIRKAFLRTPVKFTRISSKFDLNRKHPVLHKIRAHKGVDYAAPHGTEVKATSDGKVTFAGVNGGFGNVINLQHGQRYTTVYAHLSRFAKGISAGKMVKQGQIIGYVGSTGLATGPHLHYEVRVDGTHQNPLTVQLPQADPIPNERLAVFKSLAKQQLALLDSHGRVMLALGESGHD